MDHVRVAPVAGIVACLLTVVTVVAPYLVLNGAAAATIAGYYAFGAVTPLAVGFVALLGVVIFAAGRKGRSDPNLVAGVMVAIGLVSLLIAVHWALSFRHALIANPNAREFMADHRWSVVFGTVLMTLSASWYAAALDLLPVPGMSPS